MLGEVAGRPWRYEPGRPQAFYEQTVAAGYDPIYMACVRNYFERIGNGSLADRANVFATIETVLGRPATSLRQFLEAHCDAFRGAQPPTVLGRHLRGNSGLPTIVNVHSTARS